MKIVSFLFALGLDRRVRCSALLSSENCEDFFSRCVVDKILVDFLLFLFKFVFPSSFVLTSLKCRHSGVRHLSFDLNWPIVKQFQHLSTQFHRIAIKFVSLAADNLHNFVKLKFVCKCEHLQKILDLKLYLQRQI